MERKRIPMVWDLIDQFKRKCKMRGWWVSKYEDVIRADGAYHVFLWARRVHPKTFRSVTLSHCYPIRENELSYKVVNVSYTAWVFPERPPESILAIICEDSFLRKCTAIYDLSEAYYEKPICLKFNETDSIVFREFEVFLKSEYCIDLVSRLPPLVESLLI